ncbi:thiamine diphosphokinase [Candidatus Roizmanbacteria bacterium CG_4_10_14_0_2_um_filter_39_13]|uniref:Thiamine diphosphokinase n=1 Tax=Candidatus Roizmanbacteria bacterium CG_4_10_14_0_2_um_filter_39_13 TaxID=1974825 RepID=A0A2M7TVH0_9BACT|nr:MAG: thiamine diphosphokinase [Candidatus Roizmanbacteria bacterium CG_4_10_14_0_2_um_filter_39_13]
MKTTLIYLNGGSINEDRLRDVINETQYIIAVDGGANMLSKQNIIPDVLIGDMDSIDKDVYRILKQNNTKVIIHPKEKDQTDSELAISYAIDRGFKEVIITGFVGDRFDHMIATINYLSKLLTKLKVKIINNNEDIYFVTNSLQFNGKINDEVSIIPLHADAEGVMTNGLQYELNHEILQLSSTRGISNVINNPTVSILLEKGVVMVVHRHF